MNRAGKAYHHLRVLLYFSQRYENVKRTETSLGGINASAVADFLASCGDAPGCWSFGVVAEFLGSLDWLWGDDPFFPADDGRLEDGVGILEGPGMREVW